MAETTYPALEVECENCDAGYVRPESPDGRGYKCGECNGTGWVITEFGNEVLTFMKRHVKIG